MYNLNLNWREFNVNLQKFMEWVNSNVNITTPHFGTSANSLFQIHFESKPSQEEIEEIEDYWNALTLDSLEVETYQSRVDLDALREAKKDSAKAKLEALGLTADEIKAILG